MIECVVNISEGRQKTLLNRWCEQLGADLLDLHLDGDHNRSVFTMVNETAPRVLSGLAVAELDLSGHEGVHPRVGTVDVVPFVPLSGSTIHDACGARDEFARWAADTLAVPCFLYGPEIQTSSGIVERTLPFVRKAAWTQLAPDIGPATAHPRAGAICVGARMPLVAYNVWLDNCDLPTTRAIAAEVRTDVVRTLGLQVSGATQVSMNLVSPHVAGPAEAYDSVVARARIHGATVIRAELVGLVPREVLDAVPQSRWEQLDLAANKTIEWRLANHGNWFLGSQ